MEGSPSPAPETAVGCSLILVFPSNTACLIPLLSSPHPMVYPGCGVKESLYIKTFKAFSASLGLETLRVGSGGGHIFFSSSEKFSFLLFFPLGIWSFIFRVLQMAPSHTHTHTHCVVALCPDPGCGKLVL